VAEGVVEVALNAGTAAKPLQIRVPATPRTSDVVLMIRPTGVRIWPIAAGEHHLAGTVADVAFRGRGYEQAIDIAGHGRLTGVFAETRAARGESVGLRLDPAGCHVFDAAPPGPVPSPDEQSAHEQIQPRIG
jgi:ABC-type Fe3+/spermidine/putrescine transport system ATPase subunit